MFQAVFEPYKKGATINVYNTLDIGMPMCITQLLSIVRDRHLGAFKRPIKQPLVSLARAMPDAWARTIEQPARSTVIKKPVCKPVWLLDVA